MDEFDSIITFLIMILHTDNIHPIPHRNSSQIICKIKTSQIFGSRENEKNVFGKWCCCSYLANLINNLESFSEDYRMRHMTNFFVFSLSFSDFLNSVFNTTFNFIYMTQKYDFNKTFKSKEYYPRDCLINKVFNFKSANILPKGPHL